MQATIFGQMGAGGDEVLGGRDRMNSRVVSAISSPPMLWPHRAILAEPAPPPDATSRSTVSVVNQSEKRITASFCTRGLVYQDCCFGEYIEILLDSLSSGAVSIQDLIRCVKYTPHKQGIQCTLQCIGLVAFQIRCAVSAEGIGGKSRLCL